MIITLTTPAMLFPAVSLLLLAYTNRFVTLASIIRTFDPKQEDENTTEQIANLRKRIYLIPPHARSGSDQFFLMRHVHAGDLWGIPTDRQLYLCR